MNEQQPIKTQRTVTGHVVSDRMDKTIIVLVERRIKHPMYGKYIIRHSKYHAHDEENQCRIGDKVTIGEVRPLSRTKSWNLLRVHGAEQKQSGSSTNRESDE